VRQSIHNARDNVIATVAGSAMRAVTASTRTPAKLDDLAGHERLTVVQGDVTDADTVAQQVAGHDAVINSVSGLKQGEDDLCARDPLRRRRHARGPLGPRGRAEPIGPPGGLLTALCGACFRRAYRL
jgi:uncharacterized protein YbjT (DUF2867 family)